MEERSIKISLEKAREWYKQGGELKELALSAFSEKEITESALPNTWEEFCKMYPIKTKERYIGINSQLVCNEGSRAVYSDRNLLPSKEAADAHLALMQLHQLRDCYRQGWLPNWEDNIIKYCIVLESNRCVIYKKLATCNFLSFQTMELAEKFLKNFKDLIEIARDLI